MGTDAGQVLAELQHKIQSGALPPGTDANQIFDELHKIDPAIPPVGRIMRIIRYAFSVIVLLMMWYYFIHR
jgi:hypothetical protein